MTRPGPVAVPARRRGPRILVVEDTLLIATALEMLLQDLGYRVVGPVPRLAEALVMARDAPLDGALLDINLAGERSYGIADLLRWRGIPFIFTSGYSDENLPAEYRTAPRLEKPLKPQELKEAMERAFGGPVGSLTAPQAAGAGGAA